MNPRSFSGLARVFVIALAVAFTGITPAARGQDADGHWWPVFGWPSARSEHSAIYDPTGDRMLIFGGAGGTNDTWVLPLAGPSIWKRLETTGDIPPALYGHATIYDPVRRQMLVYGGIIAEELISTNRVWALALSGPPIWTELHPTSARPIDAYQGASAIYDPAQDRMVVFGGHSVYGPFLGDVWELSLSGTIAWNRLMPLGTGPAAPAARFRQSAIFDPLRGRMIVFGGNNWVNDFNDTWELSLGPQPAWRRLFPTGTPPPARVAHTAVHDPHADRMVVFGGSGRNDAWALSLAGGMTWERLSPAGPAPAGRSSHSAIYDPRRRRMVVFGGYPDTGDTWVLTLADEPVWHELIPLGTPPAGLTSATVIHDPLRDRMIVFGGSQGSGTYLDETWVFSVHEDPVWQLVEPSGTTPPGRRGHAAIYDSLRDRMIIFGGGSPNRQDTWALTLDGTWTWTEILPEGTLPGTRSSPEAIYDRARDRMLIFGGRNADDDVWELSLAGTPTWRRVDIPLPHPASRGSHDAVYDEAGDRMLIFGGANDNDVRLGDTWALSLSNSPVWNQLAAGQYGPNARTSPAAIYDPVRHRMIVFGGYCGNFEYPNGTFALSLGDHPAWTRLWPAGDVPLGRSGLAAAYDPSRDALWFFGGIGQGHVVPYDETWELLWGMPERQVSRSPAFDSAGAAPALAGAVNVHAAPNPFNAATVIGFDLPSDLDAEIRIYSVDGRPVRTLAHGPFTAGHHTLDWNGRDDRGYSAASGAYICRIATAAGVAAQKIVFVK